MSIQELFHAARDALYSLGLSYEILSGVDPDGPPVSMDSAVRDSREAMQRLQIAHDNLMRQFEHDNHPTK